MALPHGGATIDLRLCDNTRGEKYVYRSIREGSARSAKEKPGDVTSYKARYVAAESGGSVLGVGKGGRRVIQDRGYNTAEMLNAYAGYRRVLKVRAS